jgi:competence protein ComEA
MSKEDWENTVLDMVARGAPLLEEEIDTVVQYLATNLGKQTTAKVNVNKASAKDLETSLKLSAEEAREVIGYRSQNGNFAKFEDLQKVPGLDIKKLEAAKDRLEF